MGKLQQEIKKLRPFERREEEVFLNLLRTADVLSRGVEELLKTAGLTPTQYNMLRILRGAGAVHASNGRKDSGDESALACGEIAERMITRDPDITRLLDRLEQRGLITRCRGERDRRVVCSKITEEGLRLVKQLDKPVADLHRRQLGGMGEEKLTKLSQLLEEARAATA
jgi:DNA-binding MarR family transcriptional regulator